MEIRKSLTSLRSRIIVRKLYVFAMLVGSVSLLAAQSQPGTPTLSRLL